MTTTEATAPISGTTAAAAPSLAAPAAPSAAPSASLYVGELSPEVSEAMLFEIFNQIGPVASIRICRDAITRRSLGYGYVNFHNGADGERALEELNYSLIKGVPCRIMWSQRDPSIRRSGDGNVFIKNLDTSIDNKALHELFSSFGNILSCKVTLDEQGRSKGYGFVHFETREAADDAIAKLNGLLLNDKKVFVGHHVSRKERAAQSEAARAIFTNVFVKNLDESLSEPVLQKMFEPFGTITSIAMGRDEQGLSRGYGFINFEAHEAAEAAVAALNGLEVSGKALYVGRAQKKAEREEELRRQFEAAKQERSSKFAGVNLYVKNLAETVDDEKLRAEFSPFGTITSCRIMRDDATDISRGFGFVCFATADEAARASGEMNGRMIAGKPLYVAFAQRKDERRSQLEAQYSARAQQLRYQQQMAAAAAVAAGYPAGAPGPMFYAGAGNPAMAGGAASVGQVPHPRYIRPGQMGMPPTGARPPRPMRFNASAGPVGAAPGRPMAPGARRPPMGPAGMTSAGFKAPRRPEALTAAALAAATPEQQKTMLGERLYPLVYGREPMLASKITGMLLEIDKAEVLHLIEAPEALSAKVAEAVDVLRAHNAIGA